MDTLADTQEPILYTEKLDLLSKVASQVDQSHFSNIKSELLRKGLNFLKKSFPFVISDYNMSILLKSKLIAASKTQFLRSLKKEVSLFEPILRRPFSSLELLGVPKKLLT